MYDFNAGLMGFIAEYCSDMNAAAFIEMHVWPFNQINFISGRVRLFEFSLGHIVLAKCYFEWEHADTHVYMYIPQAREHYTSSVLGDRSHHSGMHAVSDTH